MTRRGWAEPIAMQKQDAKIATSDSLVFVFI
jgi:hypothetical protein